MGLWFALFQEGKNWSDVFIHVRTAHGSQVASSKAAHQDVGPGGAIGDLEQCADNRPHERTEHHTVVVDGGVWFEPFADSAQVLEDESCEAAQKCTGYCQNSARKNVVQCKSVGQSALYHSGHAAHKHETVESFFLAIKSDFHCRSILVEYISFLKMVARIMPKNGGIQTKH